MMKAVPASLAANPPSFRLTIRVAMVVGFVLMVALMNRALSATSVSQHGITWKWNEDRQVGQYANGDWFVVGPITMTSITRPNNNSGMDGSQLAPNWLATWGEQGFDSRVENIGYNASLNIANQLPYTVPVNRTVISSISHPATRRCQLDWQAVLTVVSTPPPADSFRPPYASTDKTSYFTKGNIDYAKLRSLTPTTAQGSLAGIAEAFKHPIISVGNEYVGVNYLTAFYNCPYDGKNYGQDITHATATASLLLNLNYSNSEKMALAVNIIQYGIDVYGNLLVGMKYPGAGGQNNGRKLPMLMAGVLLNNNNIISAANGMLYRNDSTFAPGSKGPNTYRRFSEDQQHFYVTQTDVATARFVDGLGRVIEPYNSSHVGMPEWGSNHDDQPTHSGSNWGIYYRDVAGPNNIGSALVCKIMGTENLWNNPAFFDYCKRFVSIERTNGKIDPFFLSMWDAYAGASTPPPQPAPPSVPTGLRIIK